MIENEPKVGPTESVKNTNEKKKKRFFCGLRNRLLALAAASFITLGAGWGRGLLEQLEVGEKGVVTELVPVSEIKEDLLGDFKHRTEKEEPEFAKLAEKFKEAIKTQLSNLETEINQHNIIDSLDHQKQDSQLALTEQQDYESGIYYQSNVHQDVDTDHKLIVQLVSDSIFLKNNHEFLSVNFDDIFWGIALLNDSKDSRNATTKFIKPPTIVFKPHFPYGVRRKADMIPLLFGDQWQPEVTIYPQAFMGLDKQVNSNTYINIVIHELGHAFLAGSGGGKKIDRKIGNDFAEVLDEGRVQSITYKIIRYLNRHSPNLRPIYKETDGYDSYLVIAEVMESIAKTHQDGDFLVKWQLGVIDYGTMIEKLKTTLDDLGLSDNVYKAIVDFRFDEDKNKVSEKFLKGLLAELKLANKVKLSEDFTESILTKGDVRY